MKAISEFFLSVNKPVLGRFHPFEAKLNISNALSTLTDTVDSAIRLQISQKHPLNSKPYFTFSDGTTSLLLSSIDGTRPVSFALGNRDFLSFGTSKDSKWKERETW